MPKKADAADPTDSPESDKTPGESIRRRRPGGGRRRDPDIDLRILVASRQTYAEFGWSGFHFDRVAKAAQVSRDVIYRRYSDREALLLDALADAVLPVVDGRGPIREQLMRYARDIYRYFTSTEGIASLRIHLEGQQFPQLYHAYRERVIDPNFVVNVGALDAAANRGTLREAVDTVAVLEAIGGGVLIHALFSQHTGAAPESAAPSENQLEATLTNFVNLALDTPRT